MTIVAAFDFDGTLTTRDTVLPFLERVAGRGRLALGALRQPLALARAGWRRDRDLAKAIVIRAAFSGLDQEAIEGLGGEYAGVIRERWLRPDTSHRLQWHRQQGHRVVLVSASLGPYLRPLAATLEADVLCTEMAVDAAGRYTGELLDGNCRGPEKVRRLRQWLDARALGGAELWAYGDSSGDRELLAAAARPFHVRRIELSPEPDDT